MEQRKIRRFQLKLPLSITLPEAELVNSSGFTRNISSSGVLFTVQREPALGAAIEYIITLNTAGPQSIKLRCMGNVLRADRLSGEEGQQGDLFQIAVTLERYEFIREMARPASQTA